MTYDALIFDLDGTLWDAAPASTEGWNRALAQLRLPIKLSAADIRSVAGNPTPRCFEILLPGLCPLSEATFRLFEDREREAIEALGGVLYEGVSEGIRRLAAVYPLFLVSNCLEWYLDAFFRLSGLGAYFTDWDCHGCSGHEKPAMLAGIAARNTLRRPLYIGDTEGDQASARQAGVDFALAAYGFGRVSQAAIEFQSFRDLVAHFLREPDR